MLCASQDEGRTNAVDRRYTIRRPYFMLIGSCRSLDVVVSVAFNRILRENAAYMNTAEPARFELKEDATSSTGTWNSFASEKNPEAAKVAMVSERLAENTLV